MLTLSTLLLAASCFRWWTLSMMEVLGFVSGGICVWLTVREHLWNWPLGLANNVFFFMLFWHSRLFADMGLQVVYFGLGIYGWMSWLYGGENRSVLRISRAQPLELVAVAVLIPISTWGLWHLLIAVNGTAPFWDALTTVLSLAAQFLLCRKRLENWFFWILADIIYIPLYWSRNLPLTAVLYGVFLLMCLVGVSAWHRNWRAAALPQVATA